jgi:hypothetical protein
MTAQSFPGRVGVTEVSAVMLLQLGRLGDVRDEGIDERGKELEEWVTDHIEKRLLQKENGPVMALMWFIVM